MCDYLLIMLRNGMFFQEAEPTSEDEYEVCDPDGKSCKFNLCSQHMKEA